VWATMSSKSRAQIGASDTRDGVYALMLVGSSMTHLLTLYFMDSGSYSKGYLDWFGYFFPTEYDWIHTVSACTRRQSGKLIPRR
jgi:hypothetical protein